MENNYNRALFTACVLIWSVQHCLLSMHAVVCVLACSHFRVWVVSWRVLFAYIYQLSVSCWHNLSSMEGLPTTDLSVLLCGWCVLVEEGNVCLLPCMEYAVIFSSWDMECNYIHEKGKERTSMVWPHESRLAGTEIDRQTEIQTSGCTDRQTDRQSNHCVTSSLELICGLFYNPQIYHTDCFRCVSCEKKLSSGEQYGLANGKLYCKTDFDSLPQDVINSPSGKPIIALRLKVYKTYGVLIPMVY